MIILPWVQGFVGFLRAPGTWILVLLNLAFAMVTFPIEQAAERRSREIATDEFLEFSGETYADYLMTHPNSGSPLVRKLVKIRELDRDSKRMIGHLGLRDDDFLDESLNKELSGDRVKTEHWQRDAREFLVNLSKYPASRWGLSTANRASANWVSHAFIHSGTAHLVGNMYFLMIFGAAVEMWLGTLAFLLGYAGGGLFSAIGYLLMQGSGGAPMVGASGAISSVMGMFCIFAFFRKVPFAYIILPIPVKYLMGTFLAPAGAAVLIWMLQDVTGLINTPQGFGGVAHAAHLGGFLAGLTLALIFKAFQKKVDENSKPGSSLPPLSLPPGMHPTVPKSFPKKKVS